MTRALLEAVEELERMPVVDGCVPWIVIAGHLATIRREAEAMEFFRDGHAKLDAIQAEMRELGEQNDARRKRLGLDTVVRLEEFGGVLGQWRGITRNFKPLDDMDSGDLWLRLPEVPER